MKIATVFALTFLTSLPLAFAQESDEANAVLQTERDLATAYLKSDAGGITQGVMEDYTLTDSMGKITTRADDISEARKNDPKYEIFENYDMKVRLHGGTAVVTGKTHTKGDSAGTCWPATSQSCPVNRQLTNHEWTPMNTNSRLG